MCICWSSVLIDTVLGSVIPRMCVDGLSTYQVIYIWFRIMWYSMHFCPMFIQDSRDAFVSSFLNLFCLWACLEVMTHCFDNVNEVTSGLSVPYLWKFNCCIQFSYCLKQKRPCSYDSLDGFVKTPTIQHCHAITWHSAYSVSLVSSGEHYMKRFVGGCHWQLL